MMESNPTYISDYKILKVIDSTYFSTIYKGYDPKMGREVAIKVLNEGSIEQFQEVIKRLSEQLFANVVPIYDRGTQDEKPFFVMPYFNGGSLQDIVSAGPIGLERVIKYIRVIAPALDNINDHGIFHCDIKPANILLDEDDNPWIADFGIAKFYKVKEGKDGKLIIGSPHYMSPEQAKGMMVDRRSDIYSLGIVIYHMLTGKLPYEDNDTEILRNKHVTQTIPKLTNLDKSGLYWTINKKLEQQLQAIINKAMAKDPNDRYSKAKELLYALDKLITTIPLPPQHLKNRNVSSCLTGSSPFLVSLFWLVSVIL